MKVDTKEVNPAFQSIIQNPGQKVFLDANFFIPPDRSEVAKVRAYSFTDFKECWLIPLLSEFAGLAIHESVYDELVADSVKKYADEQTSCIPPKLKIHYDSELSSLEEALRNTYINKIAVHSLYNPTRDNAKDRGEVRSLSFMAVKQFLYFAANDALPVRLIKDAAKLMLQAASEFGLTPSSRSRIVAGNGKAKETEDEMEALLGDSGVFG